MGIQRFLQLKLDMLECLWKTYVNSAVWVFVQKLVSDLYYPVAVANFKAAFYLLRELNATVVFQIKQQEHNTGAL